MTRVTCRCGRYVGGDCRRNAFCCRAVVASRTDSGRIRVCVTATFKCRVIGGIRPRVAGITCHRSRNM